MKALFLIGIAIMLLIGCSISDTKNKGLINSSRQGYDSTLFANVINSNGDRMLFFEKNFFIRITESLTSEDTLLKIVYGKYKVLNDTIFFSPPDSTDKNSVFGYYNTRYDPKKKIQFCNEDSSFSSIDSIYSFMFKKNSTINIRTGFWETFVGLKKGDSLIFDHNIFFPVNE
jgi:hypothetical protein